MTANLNPTCSATGTIRYTWEITNVDMETGLFNMIYQWGKHKLGINKFDIWTNFVPTEGLHYIRCIVRKDGNPGVYAFKYDFGFFELVRMKPLRCIVKPSQGKAALDKFQLRCSGSYKGVKAIGYTSTLDLSNEPLVLAVWRSPNGTITLPAGNPKEDYNVRVKVEAMFPSLPSLFANILVKVSYI